jgi:hypothetical protein
MKDIHKGADEDSIADLPVDPELMHVFRKYFAEAKATRNSLFSGTDDRGLCAASLISLASCHARSIARV